MSEMDEIDILSVFCEVDANQRQGILSEEENMPIKKIEMERYVESEIEVICVYCEVSIGEAKELLDKYCEIQADKVQELVLLNELYEYYEEDLDEDMCQRVKTGTLYTQCSTRVAKGVRYCPKCRKEAEMNRSRTPNKGDIEHKKRRKPQKIGEVNEECCKGIIRKKRYYVQCPSFKEKGKKYCKKCRDYLGNRVVSN